MGILSAIQKIVVDRYNKDSTLMLCSDLYYRIDFFVKYIACQFYRKSQSVNLKYPISFLLLQRLYLTDSFHQPQFHHE